MRKINPPDTPAQWHQRPKCCTLVQRKRGTSRQAIGKSKGGWITKIVALTDALGNLVRFELLPGQRGDTVGVPPLIEILTFDALIADKAYDLDWLMADLDARGAKVVISQRPRRAQARTIDETTYAWRHLVENFFCNIKNFKRVSRRSDKTDTSYRAMILAAASVLETRD
ncbi:MAG: IS5 family transposase [Devosia sp.]